MVTVLPWWLPWLQCYTTRAISFLYFNLLFVLQSPFFYCNLHFCTAISFFGCQSPSLLQSLFVLQSPFCIAIAKDLANFSFRNETTLLKVQDSLFHEQFKTTMKINNSILSYLLLRYFVEFFHRAGKVIRCLTTLMVCCSQRASLTNNNYSQRPGGCPVSKQENQINYV